MNSESMKESLLEATLLVLKAINKEISFREFVKEYDNFYYFEALDGHEADEIQIKILEEFKIAIQFHEKVQIDVIDLLYLDEANKEQFMETGRIDEPEAIKRLNEIGDELKIDDIIGKFKGKV